MEPIKFYALIEAMAELKNPKDKKKNPQVSQRGKLSDLQCFK